MELKEITLLEDLEVEEILQRLPNFIVKRIKFNCNEQKRTSYFYKTNIFNLVNNFTWALSKEGNFWSIVEDCYINIVVPHPIKERIFKIKVKNYYQRNEIYRNLLKKIDKLGIVEFDINNFRMFIEFNKQIID